MTEPLDLDKIWDELKQISGKETKEDALIYFALSRIGELEQEVRRLDHLHKLDHSLADQWQAKNVKLQEEIDKLKEELESVSSGERLSQYMAENMKLTEEVKRLKYDNADLADIIKAYEEKTEHLKEVNASLLLTIAHSKEDTEGL